jgi:hypothetical protein
MASSAFEIDLPIQSDALTTTNARAKATSIHVRIELRVPGFGGLGDLDRSSTLADFGDGRLDAMKLFDIAEPCDHFLHAFGPSDEVGLIFLQLLLDVGFAAGSRLDASAGGTRPPPSSARRHISGHAAA